MSVENIAQNARDERQARAELAAFYRALSPPVTTIDEPLEQGVTPGVEQLMGLMGGGGRR